MHILAATVGVLFAVSSASGEAPVDSRLEERGRFEVVTEQIAEGVHVMFREPSWRLPVQANTALIVSDSDAILIDGGFGAHAENVVREVRRITDRPVRVIINTHWHGDHNIGHYVFKREWPAARIVAHRETRRLMAEENVMDYVSDTAEADDERLLAPRRQRLAELRAQGADDGLIAYVADSIEGMPAVRDQYGRWVVQLADETFAERLVLHRGDREIRILHFGPANTPGDAIVWLPDERIVFTGDVVVRPTPYGFGSSPAGWVEVLREIKALDFEILVPGHGDLQSDAGYVDLLIRTLGMVADAACGSIDRLGEDADADAVYQAVDWPAVEEGFTGGDPLLARLFEVWFKRPIASGALAEASARGGDRCR